MIPVDGGTSDTAGAVEANLDLDIVRAVAPAAQILFYEVPSTTWRVTSPCTFVPIALADHTLARRGANYDVGEAPRC